MAILNRDEFIERVQRLVGERDDDETIKVIEDFTDTYDDYERSKESTDDDWKSKYDELDNEWRRKYKERFFTTGEKIIRDQTENIKDDGRVRSYDELFEEREG